MVSSRRNLPHAPSLHLVQPHQSTSRSRFDPLVWWHLLSLDAPTVATTWTLFFAGCAGVKVGVADPLAIFIAVWILYAADRLMDSRPLGQRDTPAALEEIEERHRFHFRHRRRFLPGVAAMTIPLAFLLHSLPNEVLHMYVMLAALLSGWLLLVHGASGPGGRRLPKELAVAVFFPAAVFIPTLARGPRLGLALFSGVLLLACVCLLNCVFLYIWEHPKDLSRAHASTRVIAVHVLLSSLLLLGASGVLWVILNSGHTAHGAGGLLRPSLPALAVFLSTLSLLCLHALRHRIAPLRLRALADLVLLIPWPLAIGARLISVHR